MNQADPLPWLLESENPSTRYLTLTGLLDRPADDPEAIAALSAIPQCGPARSILDAQWPEGYWVRPGRGYSPRHRATMWQLIFLAALGAPRSEAIDRACAHVLGHSRLPDGRFSAHTAARGSTACLNGSLCRAMLQLGCDDPRLDESLEALAVMVARDGLLCRFSRLCAGQGPPSATANDELPCTWGAIKALGAFAEAPAQRRSSAMKTATEVSVDLLLAGDLARGDYPAPGDLSPLWRRFGFPLGCTSDLLEALDVLDRIGVKNPPRLVAAVDAVLSKQDSSGRWALEYTPPRTWAEFGELGRPNKWVTWRALRVLKRWHP